MFKGIEVFLGEVVVLFEGVLVFDSYEVSVGDMV